MKRIYPLIVLLAMVPWASAWEPDLADSTCRVVADFGAKRGMGSGCCFAVDGRLVGILTNAHVVTSDSGQTARRVTCEFWSAGHLSRRLVATVVGVRRDATVDAAVLTIPLAAFGGRPPKAIPLDPTAVIRPGETLYSAGCPNGSWATAWKGHALRTTGSTVYFLPVPADGRSGSAIVRGTGDDARIVALLYARRLDESEGVACTAASLFRPTQYMIPDPDCPEGRCQNRQFQLFGRQYGAEPDAQGNPFPTNPYPTLPGMTPMNPAPGAPGSVGPSVDPAVNSRLTALEAKVIAGEELVRKLGLLEADTASIEAIAETLTDSMDATEADIDDLEALEAITSEQMGIVADAIEAQDEKQEAQDEQQEKTNGWINVLLGMAGAALAGVVPGGGIALWALKRTGAAEKLKEQVKGVSASAIDRLDAKLDRLTDRIPGTADDALKDKLLAALKKAL